MRLFEALQEFKANLETLEQIKKEVLESTQEENLKAKLQDAFNSLESNLKEDLKAQIHKELSQARVDLSANITTEIENIFLKNLEVAAQNVGERLNLNEISARVAKNLEKKNQENILKLFKESFNSSEYQTTLQNLLSKVEKEINAKAKTIKNTLDSKMSQTHNFNVISYLETLSKELIEKNKDTILKSQNLSFLKNTLESSPALKREVRTASKLASEKYVEEKGEEFVSGALKNRAHEVFVDVYNSDEVKKARALATFHLKAISLQSEIWIIENCIARIHALRLAKGGKVQNIHKVI
ncbi:hypothetical protein LS70_003840 [Helicobacter sp. MIT 11-5569]|uniref:hypothetical protein n=1 Tax=Helicobacter sp. MIT 11-5569 TaxID=1548151 RepID=UPI00051FB98D|nr:hypothetical protein [Helicobacter sp. MIT 11-5569]TLD83950.1 hypothetical protein LS70_003840 [Helicobacter sp. MIT 11-5569]